MSYKDRNRERLATYKALLRQIESFDTAAEIRGFMHSKIDAISECVCDGCRGDFEAWELAEVDGKNLCIDCTEVEK